MALLGHTSKAEASFPCEPSLIFEILTDYDGYMEWVPLLTQSKLLAKEGDLALAEVSLQEPIEDKLVFECIHDKNRSVLLRAISGELPVAKVEWSIEPVGPSECKVAVVMEGKPDRRWLLPSYRKVLDADVHMGALKGQISAFSPELHVSGPGGEVILDLLETEEGMMLIYRGQKYLLQPIAEKQA